MGMGIQEKLLAEMVQYSTSAARLHSQKSDSDAKWELEDLKRLYSTGAFDDGCMQRLCHLVIAYYTARVEGEDAALLYYLANR